MSKTELRRMSAGITAKLDAMIDRERAAKTYLARNVYRAYQKAQLERFKTEGRSEGGQWDALNPRYATSKLTRFAAYPGAGRRMMIATDRLRSSVVGPHPDHRLLVTDRSIRIATTVPYAVYASDARDLTHFRPERIREWKKGIASFITKGKMT